LAGRVVQVDEASPYAFTHGIWRPSVVVSTGLVAATTHDELVAVLRHEDFHRRHRDPLRVLAVRTWSAAFFFIPILGTFLRRGLTCQELRADRAAVRAGGVAPVAGALLKAIGEPAVAPKAALAAMGGATLLETRVTYLETGRGPRLRAALRPVVVLASLPGIGLLAGHALLMCEICMAVWFCR
jgi:Zn-dependent protease with chaperone function